MFFFVVSSVFTPLYKSGDTQGEAEAILLCLLLCYIWADENTESEIMPWHQTKKLHPE